MANYYEKPKKKKSGSSRDIALDKLDFYDTPQPKKKKIDKIAGRPKSPMKRFCIATFPQKEDSGFEKFRKVFLLCAIVAFAATIGILMGQLLGMNNGRQINNDIINIAGAQTGTIDMDMDYDPFNTNANSEVVEEDPEEEINVTPVTNTPLSIDFPALQSVNRDTRAWIKITGTHINNVVVQSTDNEYYLDHDFYKNESISGTIYSSYKNKWDGTDDNIILYGHNMLSGDFFASLGHYAPNDASREPVAFYKVHPTVMMATPNGGSETYKIFAGALLNTQEEYGEVFDYVNKTSFSGVDDFNNFVLKVMDYSWFFTDVDITYGDQLLTLSTCFYPLGKTVDTRWVIFARKVRPGESEYVDTSVATRNYSAKLFDYYYSVIGGQWYGSVWDKSKLLSYSG